MGEDDVTQIIEQEDGLPASLEPKGGPPKKEPFWERAKDMVIENPIKTATAAALVFAVAGGLMRGGVEIQITPAHVQIAISEITKTPIRFVGGPQRPDATKVSSLFGEAVVYDSIPPEARCLVIFIAKMKEGSSPPVPELTFPGWWMDPGPTYLGSLQGPSSGGEHYWMGTFRGNGCLAIADRPEFIASDTHQLISHPRARKLLRQRAREGVKDKDGRPIRSLPFLDPQANPDGEAWFPFGLSGRDDLNFVKSDGVHPRKRREQE